MMVFFHFKRKYGYSTLEIAVMEDVDTMPELVRIAEEWLHEFVKDPGEWERV